MSFLIKEFTERLLGADQSLFQDCWHELFYYQYHQNPVFRQFADYLGKTPSKVSTPEDLPFLPVEVFKTHKVYCENQPTPELIFESSGTTGSVVSKHYVASPSVYLKHSKNIFESFYGDITRYSFLALLPSYLERGHSSLVCMVDSFIQQANGGFFMNEYEELTHQMHLASESGKIPILFGVGYALLNYAETYPNVPNSLIVIETGGMKGRRKEMIREEVHEMLCHAFSVKTIHAEYGMTELLSQAYSKGNGLFHCPPSMHVYLRDPHDPLEVGNRNSGGINLIDLANVHSCCFLSTQDIGSFHENDLKILGRFDHSDLRGCNLLAEG